jgi:hypothetical protein
VLSSKLGPGAPAAALDCGSHSTRLLIATRQQELARLTTDTCLGKMEQVPGGGPLLTQEGMQSVALALQRYRGLLQQHGVQRCRAAATAAVREAANAGAFLEAASAALGHPVEVISGECVCLGAGYCLRGLRGVRASLPGLPARLPACLPARLPARLPACLPAFARLLAPA